MTRLAWIISLAFHASLFWIPVTTARSAPPQPHEIVFEFTRNRPVADAVDRINEIDQREEDEIEVEAAVVEPAEPARAAHQEPEIVKHDREPEFDPQPVIEPVVEPVVERARENPQMLPAKDISAENREPISTILLSAAGQASKTVPAHTATESKATFASPASPEIAAFSPREPAINSEPISDIINYGDYLRTKIDGAKTYPRMMKRLGIEGTATVGFIVKADGRVNEILLEESSGAHALDSAAMNAVRRASPFRPPPHEIDRPFTVQISFLLN